REAGGEEADARAGAAPREVEDRGDVHGESWCASEGARTAPQVRAFTIVEADRARRSTNHRGSAAGRRRRRAPARGRARGRCLAPLARACRRREDGAIARRRLEERPIVDGEPGPTSPRRGATRFSPGAGERRSRIAADLVVAVRAVRGAVALPLERDL